MDWLEEWKKRDPYLSDMDGFLKFVEQKEKELQVKIQVWVDEGYNGGYQIYLTVPINAVPDEYKNTDILLKTEEIEKTADKIRKFLSPNMDRCAPNRLGLRPGATTVFRNKDGEWFYYGDYSHIPGEDIDSNAKILWKIWRTVGSHFPSVSGVSKDYQCDCGSVYLRYASEKPDFPALGRYEMSLERTIGETERWNVPIKPLETEEPEGLVWEELSVFAHSLMLEDVPNIDDPFGDDYVWITQDDLPVCSLWRQSIPEVIDHLARGREVWNPEDDFDLMSSGGLSLIHPFLREERTLVWRDEDVEWDSQASHMRELYYKTFNQEELEATKVDTLKDVCKAKNLSVKHRKHDMIEAILEANYDIKQLARR